MCRTYPSFVCGQRDPVLVYEASAGESVEVHAGVRSPVHLLQQAGCRRNTALRQAHRASIAGALGIFDIRYIYYFKCLEKSQQ